MSGSEIERRILDIYAATRDMREAHKADLGALYGLGFKILHGPPLAHPPVLFVGIQPGGDVADTASGEMFGWPARLDYETGRWPLAQYVRNLFSGHVDVLMSCNVTNANFFRAPRDSVWREAPLPTRKAIEKFCVQQLEIIVEQLQPRAIVVTGMGVLRQAAGFTTWENEEKRLFGVRAVRVIHTAARDQTTEVRDARDEAILKIAGLPR